MERNGRIFTLQWKLSTFSFVVRLDYFCFFSGDLLALVTLYFLDFVEDSSSYSPIGIF